MPRLSWLYIELGFMCLQYYCTGRFECDYQSHMLKEVEKAVLYCIWEQNTEFYRGSLWRFYRTGCGSHWRAHMDQMCM